LNGIIDTVPVVHPLLPLIGLLKSHGKLVIVGGPEKPLELPVFPLLMGKHKQNNTTCFIKVHLPLSLCLVLRWIYQNYDDCDDFLKVTLYSFYQITLGRHDSDIPYDTKGALYSATIFY